MSSDTASKSRAAIELLGQQQGPIEVTQFEVDSSGKLTAARDDKRLRLHFVHQGLMFALEAGKLGGCARIAICTHLGHFPFSIESANGRRNVQAILTAAACGIPRGRLHVSPHGEIFLEGVFEIDARLTPAVILAAAADFIARNRHHIVLMMEYSPSMPAPRLARHWLDRLAAGAA